MTSVAARAVFSRRKGTVRYDVAAMIRHRVTALDEGDQSVPLARDGDRFGIISILSGFRPTRQELERDRVFSPIIF
jgi:hypothetical protein